MGRIFGRIRSRQFISRSLIAGIFALYASLAGAAEDLCDAALSATSLRLKSGLEVKLVGILAPLRQKREALGIEAFNYASKLCQGKKITFAEERDRYGRAFAPVQDFQLSLLKEGLARVEPSLVTTGLAELFHSENIARNKRAGIWNVSSYYIKNLDELAGSLGKFEIIEGNITEIFKGKDGYHLKFADKFQIIVPLKMATQMRKDGFLLVKQLNKKIRVRGWVDKYVIPTIKLHTPAQIENL